VVSAAGGDAALELFKKDLSGFDLVITDQTMPQTTGIELARRMLSLRPETTVILYTGYSYVVNEESARAAGVRAFVMKPLTKREMARTVREVLDG
jgi:YesN/AraC family two-component response regulator